MKWNYRVVRHVEISPDQSQVNWYQIHSVYYDKHGKITAWCKEPVKLGGETIPELADVLKDMLAIVNAASIDLSGAVNNKILNATDMPVDPRKGKLKGSKLNA